MWLSSYRFNSRAKWCIPMLFVVKHCPNSSTHSWIRSIVTIWCVHIKQSWLLLQSNLNTFLWLLTILANSFKWTWSSVFLRTRLNSVSHSKLTAIVFWDLQLIYAHLLNKYRLIYFLSYLWDIFWIIKKNLLQ